MGDFRAFYCAARVASHGARSVSHRAPARRARRASAPRLFFAKNPGVTIPAPLPGYAIAALVPLSVLPFAAAATIWSLLLLAAWLACIVALCAVRTSAVGDRVGGVRAVAGCGIAAARRGRARRPRLHLPRRLLRVAGPACARPRSAGAGAMIEPHLGLPVCIALAVWMPATRVALAMAFGALAALSFAVLGAATNVEYFTSVLPAHALSELGRDTQFSLTAVLAGAGLAPGAAVRAGSLVVCGDDRRGDAAGGRLRAPNAQRRLCRLHSAGVCRVRRNVHSHHANSGSASRGGAARGLVHAEASRARGHRALTARDSVGVGDFARIGDRAAGPGGVSRLALLESERARDPVDRHRRRGGDLRAQLVGRGRTARGARRRARDRSAAGRGVVERVHAEELDQRVRHVDAAFADLVGSRLAAGLARAGGRMAPAPRARSRAGVRCRRVHVASDRCAALRRRRRAERRHRFSSLLLRGARAARRARTPITCSRFTTANAALPRPTTGRRRT